MKIHAMRILVVVVFAFGIVVPLVSYYYRIFTNSERAEYYRILSQERGELLDLCQDKLEPKNIHGYLTGTWYFSHESPEFCLRSIDPERGPIYYCYELPETFTALNIIDAMDKGFGRPHYTSR